MTPGFVIIGPVVDEKLTFWNGDEWTTKPEDAEVFTRGEVFSLPLPTEGVSVIVERDTEGKFIKEYVPLLGGNGSMQIFEKQP